MRGMKPREKYDPERLGERVRTGLGAWHDISNTSKSVVFVLLHGSSVVTDRSHISELSFDVAQICGKSISERSLRSALLKISLQETQMGILRREEGLLGRCFEIL